MLSRSVVEHAKERMCSVCVLVIAHHGLRGAEICAFLLVSCPSIVLAGSQLK